MTGYAQGYRLQKVNDTLYYLNEWQLPYPVYQFQTGDVDGDDSEDAVVGVIKSTRFYPEKARRVFIFKQVNSKVRPLWMGSRLGGILQDFKLSGNSIVSLETNGKGRYAVAVYSWEKFGMEFQRFIVKDTDSITASKAFAEVQPPCH